MAAVCPRRCWADSHLLPSRGGGGTSAKWAAETLVLKASAASAVKESISLMKIGFNNHVPCMPPEMAPGSDEGALTSLARKASTTQGGGAFSSLLTVTPQDASRKQSSRGRGGKGGAFHTPRVGLLGQFPPPEQNKRRLVPGGNLTPLAS